VLKVHPIDPRQKGQRDEDRGDDGQHLYHLVHPVAHYRQVEVEHPGENVPAGLDAVDDADGVVMDIPQVDDRRFLNQGRPFFSQSSVLSPHCTR
jgi:hypothetical protein